MDILEWMLPIFPSVIGGLNVENSAKPCINNHVFNLYNHLFMPFLANPLYLTYKI